MRFPSGDQYGLIADRASNVKRDGTLLPRWRTQTWGTRLASTRVPTTFCPSRDNEHSFRSSPAATSANSFPARSSQAIRLDVAERRLYVSTPPSETENAAVLRIPPVSILPARDSGSPFSCVRAPSKAWNI